MKNLLKIVMAAALSLLYQYGYAAGDKYEESPAVKVLETSKKTRRLEGSTLKMARPILKKTPISVIMDNIEMMMICPLEKNGADLTAKAEKMLRNYTMVREINDELSHIYIYIDRASNDRFSELILYTESPEANIMLFAGDFTIEGLMKVGERSVQDRKERIRARHQ